MEKTPNHIAIIIDGNRRWAKERKLPAFEGHRRGLKNVKKASQYLFDRGAEYLTFYVFSTENWKRSSREISYLMKLLGRAFDKKEIDYYQRRGVKIRVMGQRGKLSSKLRKKIEEAEERTKDNKKQLILCISYGGRAEITDALKKIIEKRISKKDITEKLIEENLWSKDTPPPDLIIRTGKEKRLSNFLTWQSAYSELYFSDEYWPEFKEKDMDRAIEDFRKRQRRFGK